GGVFGAQPRHGAGAARPQAGRHRAAGAAGDRLVQYRLCVAPAKRHRHAGAPLDRSRGRAPAPLTRPCASPGRAGAWPAGRAVAHSTALTMSTSTFLASPNTIMVRSM